MWSFWSLAVAAIVAVIVSPGSLVSSSARTRWACSRLVSSPLHLTPSPTGSQPRRGATYAAPMHHVPLAELVSLAGRTAVVTGASRGIGAAVAARLAEAG